MHSNASSDMTLSREIADFLHGYPNESSHSMETIDPRTLRFVIPHDPILQ
jgi:Fe-S-cluster formation regulator IscX/YfhJ